MNKSTIVTRRPAFGRVKQTNKLINSDTSADFDAVASNSDSSAGEITGLVTLNEYSDMLFYLTLQNERESK